MFLTSLARSLSRHAGDPPESRQANWQPVYDAAETSGFRSSTGLHVGRDHALTLASFWRGVNLIANGVAKIPLHVYRNLKPGKMLDTNHPAYFLLRRKPNELMAAANFRKTLQAHAIVGGNGYAYIFRDSRDGTPTEIYPLNPDMTYPVLENGKLLYVTQLGFDGVYQYRKLLPENILHIHGLGFDGFQGYSLIQYARECLGLGLAAEKYSAIHFKNSGRPSVILVVPGKLNDEARKRLRTEWQNMTAGIENAHKTAVLDGGVTAQPMQLNARDSQMIESQEFTTVQVANFLNIPPHKLGGKVSTSYSSLEMEEQAYLDDGLDPWLVAWEEQCWDKLLTEREKREDSHAVLFDRSKLVQANLDARTSHSVQALNNGIKTLDEVREEWDLNPVPEGLGEKYRLPANIQFLGETPPAPPAPSAPNPPGLGSEAGGMLPAPGQEGRGAPDQPRDNDGKFASGGGSSNPKISKHLKNAAGLEGHAAVAAQEAHQVGQRLLASVESLPDSQTKDAVQKAADWARRAHEEQTPAYGRLAADWAGEAAVSLQRTQLGDKLQADLFQLMGKGQQAASAQEEADKLYKRVRQIKQEPLRSEVKGHVVKVQEQLKELPDDSRYETLRELGSELKQPTREGLEAVRGEAASLAGQLSGLAEHEQPVKTLRGIALSAHRGLKAYSQAKQSRRSLDDGWIEERLLPAPGQEGRGAPDQPRDNDGKFASGGGSSGHVGEGKHSPRQGESWSKFYDRRLQEIHQRKPGEDAYTAGRRAEREEQEFARQLWEQGKGPVADFPMGEVGVLSVREVEPGFSLKKNPEGHVIIASSRFKADMEFQREAQGRNSSQLRESFPASPEDVTRVVMTTRALPEEGEVGADHGFRKIAELGDVDRDTASRGKGDRHLYLPPEGMSGEEGATKVKELTGGKAVSLQGSATARTELAQAVLPDYHLLQGDEDQRVTLSVGNGWALLTDHPYTSFGKAPKLLPDIGFRQLEEKLLGKQAKRKRSRSEKPEVRGNQDQPRDEGGRWSDTGTGAAREQAVRDWDSSPHPVVSFSNGSKGKTEFKQAPDGTWLQRDDEGKPYPSAYGPKLVERERKAQAENASELAEKFPQEDKDVERLIITRRDVGDKAEGAEKVSALKQGLDQDRALYLPKEGVSEKDAREALRKAGAGRTAPLSSDAGAKALADSLPQERWQAHEFPDEETAHSIHVAGDWHVLDDEDGHKVVRSDYIQVRVDDAIAVSLPDDAAPRRHLPDPALLAAHHALLADAARRMVRRVAHVAQRAAKKSATFPAFLESLEAEHGAVVEEAMGPAVTACAVLLRGSPDQPRDNDGKFASGGGGKSRSKGQDKAKGAGGAPVSPMKGHPFEGLTHDQMIDRLTSVVLHEVETKTTKDYAGFSKTVKDGPAIQADILKVVSEKSDRYGGPELPAVYEAVQKDRPQLTIAQFQGLLGELSHQGKVKLDPHTRSVGSIEKPEHVFPLDGELMYHVRPGGNRSGDISAEAARSLLLSEVRHALQSVYDSATPAEFEQRVTECLAGLEQRLPGEVAGRVLRFNSDQPLKVQYVPHSLDFGILQEGDESPETKARLLAEVLASLLDEGEAEEWLREYRYHPEQPRHPDGTWQAKQAHAAGKAAEILAAHQGQKLPKDKLQELSGHFQVMTAKDLHALTVQHGLKVGPGKAALAGRIREKIQAKLAEEQRGNPDQPRDKDGKFGSGSGGGGKAGAGRVTPHSKEQIDRLIAEGHREVFRGVTDTKHADAMRRGESFAGEGDYGNGIYVTTDPTMASSYAAGPEGTSAGDVVRGALDKSANVQPVEKVEKLHRQAVEEGKIKPTQDLGTFARSQGIDAIEVKHKSYINVVNPAVLFVDKDTRNAEEQRAFDPDQPRDESGKWGSGGSGAGGGKKTKGRTDAKPSAGILERLKQDARGDEQVEALREVQQRRQEMEKTIAPKEQALAQQRDALLAEFQSMPAEQQASWREKNFPKVMALEKERGALRSDFEKESREAVARVLAVADPAKVEMDLSADVTSDVAKKSVMQSQEWLQGKVSKNALPEQSSLAAQVSQIPADEKQRSNCLGAQVNLTEGANVSTAVHEMGHVLENANPEIGRLAQDFLRERFRDEPLLTRLNDVDPGASYDDNEYGRKDNFDKVFGPVNAYYVGRASYSSSEAISMGLQALHDDPVHFATKDPEYFKFITGVLDGRLLKGGKK
jgi:HK97 family phage portal protein